MKADEARQIVDVVNSLIEEDATVVEEGVIEATEETIEVPRPKLTEEETNKLFRRSVPEGFSWDDAIPARAPITGDRVFLTFNGEKRWIPDLETLEKMGWNLGEVQNIPDEAMRELKEGFGLFSAKLW